jgi:hypothetical protein
MWIFSLLGCHGTLVTFWTKFGSTNKRNMGLIRIKQVFTFEAGPVEVGGARYCDKALVTQIQDSLNELIERSATLKLTILLLGEQTIVC